MKAQFAAHIIELLGGESAIARAIGAKVRFTAIVGKSPGVCIEAAGDRLATSAEVVSRSKGGFTVRVCYAGGGSVSQEVSQDSLAIAIPVLTGWRLPAVSSKPPMPDRSIAAMAF